MYVVCYSVFGEVRSKAFFLLISDAFGYLVRRIYYGMAKGIYATKRWIKLRAKILKRDGYLCQVSKRYGRHVEATTVHHIFPVTQYPQYALCDWNLISVSSSVHNTFHDRDTDELTEDGLKLMYRVARQRGISIDPPPKFEKK